MTVRTDWTREEMATPFDLPFDDRVYQTATFQRAHHAGDDNDAAMLAKLALALLETAA